jgi:hypothetical protein
MTLEQEQSQANGRFGSVLIFFNRPHKNIMKPIQLETIRQYILKAITVREWCCRVSSLVQSTITDTYLILKCAHLYKQYFHNYEALQKYKILYTL